MLNGDLGASPDIGQIYGNARSKYPHMIYFRLQSLAIPPALRMVGTSYILRIFTQFLIWMALFY